MSLHARAYESISAEFRGGPITRPQERIETASASRVIRRDFRAAPRGGRLELDAHCGSVCVEAADTLEVSVAVVIERADGRPIRPKGEPVVDFEERGSRICIRSRGAGPLPWLPPSHQLRLRFNVTVPRNFHVEVATRGGSVAVKDVGGDVRVRTAGGWLEFRNIGGRIHATTTGGGIQVAGCLRDVDAKTGGGPIEVAGALGSVRANTRGGAIQARFEAPPKGRLQTSGGNLDVWFPARAGALVDARTGGGQIAVDHAMQQTHGETLCSQLRGKINGGGASLVLRTKGGSIRVREA